MQRLYQSYTTKQLKEILSLGNLSDDMAANINAEIAAREAARLTVAKMEARVSANERVKALKADWRANGCRMTLARKLEALKNAKEGK